MAVNTIDKLQLLSFHLFDVKKLQDVTFTITETLNTLFPVVNFTKCIATEVVLFSVVALKTLDSVM